MGRAHLRRGFTLVEVLVALAVMALMTALAWRGLDAMSRAQARLRGEADAVLALQAALAQWSADLDAVAWQPRVESLAWDGRSLRILRRDPAAPADGLRVVAWALRGVGSQADWLRWQSPPLRTHGEREQAWQQAALWAQAPASDDLRLQVRMLTLSRWQIFYHRGGAWTNPLSSDGNIPSGNARASTLPDGLRLVLDLPSEGPVAGVLTLDWVRPTLEGAR